MLKHDAALPEEPHFILSTLSPSAAHRRLAFAVVAGISAVFALIALGPFQGLRFRRVDAFVPMYATAMFVCDSITAILLYAQFAIVRSRAILVIASDISSRRSTSSPGSWCSPECSHRAGA